MYYKISNILTFLENSINKGITKKPGRNFILSDRILLRVGYGCVSGSGGSNPDPHVSSIYMIAALNPVRLHFLYIAFLIPDLDLISSSFYVPFFSVHIQISSIIL